MIAVKVFWNTHSDGHAVDFEEIDWDDINAPISIYGPFDSLEEAESWMDYYPDGDDDLYDMEADDYNFPQRYVINPPNYSFPWPPEDEELDSQELQGP